VQIQLRQQAADLLRAKLEQRQQPTLESRLQSPHAWPTNRDRARHRAQPPGLAVPILIARGRVHGVPPSVAGSAKHAIDLSLQHPLQQPLNTVPGERLRLSQVGFDSADVAVLFSFMGGFSFSAFPARRWFVWSRTEGYTVVYTPTDVTSPFGAMASAVTSGDAAPMRYCKRDMNTHGR
jgi:hypothetical protein